MYIRLYFLKRDKRIYLSDKHQDRFILVLFFYLIQFFVLSLIKLNFQRTQIKFPFLNNLLFDLQKQIDKPFIQSFPSIYLIYPKKSKKVINLFLSILQSNLQNQRFSMNKLQQVRYAAAYTALAQKLDMHIKNFDSDINTQTRWVWQLIQNAKDAPNRFKQTKIKQEVDDINFTSRHNGDAFQIPQLHSIVAQYSTKKQKNSQLTKTTGKYGTGFITTYILSKIIQLSGILMAEIDEDSDDEKQHEQSQSQDQEQKLSRKIRQQKEKPSKFKDNENISRILRNEIKSKGMNDRHMRKRKPYIKKSRNSRDFEKRKNQLAFEKEFQKLKIEQEKEYQEEMKQLEGEMKQLSTDELPSFADRTNLKIKQKKKKRKNKKKQFYLKEFRIQMDRSYTDRDQELPKKIQKTERKLTKIVQQADYQASRNIDNKTRDYYQKQRTVDSYDTVFKYKLTEQKKFAMIQNTILNLRELIPYAFLFNDNLTYYEFIDKRKQPMKGLSFSITKGDTVEIDKNIYLFAYQLDEEYDVKQQKFLKTSVGYIVSYFLRNKAIAAVPVHIESTGIKVLKVNPKLPKYFKDFPLIGCTDLKWNALINARQFYPNQKRSQLMLHYEEETNRQKVETNWKHLYSCLNAVKEIYLFLSHHCQNGLENLLIFNCEIVLAKENELTNRKDEFNAFLQGLVREIINTKFIPNRITQGDAEKRFVQPINLVFIELASKEQEILKKEQKWHYDLSYKANEAFSFLMGEKNTLATEYYEDFYSILNYSSVYRKDLELRKLVNFASVNDCLRKMETLTLQQFCVVVKSDYIKKLHQIYSLLKQYNQFAYLSLSTQPCFDFKIMLSEENEFQSLRADQMMFNLLPEVYEELCEKLRINIKSNLINKEFDKYIKQVGDEFNLNIPKLQIRILEHFNIYFITYDENKKICHGMSNLLLLFRLLITFQSIKTETIDLIKRFVEFEKAEPFHFKSDKKELRKFTDQIKKRLLTRFIQGFMIYFSHIVIETPDLKNLLTKKISIKYFDEAIDFLKDLFKDDLLGKSLGTIQMKLSWNGIFVNENTLNKLNQKTEYPDFQDIQIYNIGYNIVTQGIFSTKFNKTKLEDRLVHPFYSRDSLNRIKEISFKQLYLQFQQNYESDYNVTQQQRHQILNYAEQINQKYKYGTKLDNTLIEKYEAWKPIIQKRLEKLFYLKNQNKELQSEETKEFLFKLINDPVQLKNAQIIFANNNNKLFFTNLAQQLKLIPSQLKKEEPKQLPKK